jgi:hypothetical protein
MSEPKTDKSKDEEVAQATRERELRDLIGRVGREKSGSVPPSNESPNDFVERRMREKLNK